MRSKSPKQKKAHPLINALHASQARYFLPSRKAENAFYTIFEVNESP